MRKGQLLLKGDSVFGGHTMLHTLTIERVILTMRERLNENLSLENLAEVALLSPSYFNRVFRYITGLPPRLFLAALRLEKAKRLLLTTRCSITDACFDVGYASLGTFTTRFTQFVGVTPSRFRFLAEEQVALSFLEELHAVQAALHKVTPFKTGNGISGRVSTIESSTFTGLIFVGLFSTPLPQGMPVGCAILTAPGPYHIASVPDGHHYLLVTALEWTKDPLAYLLTEDGLRGGIVQYPVLVCNGRVGDHVNITLRRAQLIDPPVLLSLPLLLAERLSASSTGAVVDY